MDYEIIYDYDNWCFIILNKTTNTTLIVNDTIFEKDITYSIINEILIGNESKAISCVLNRYKEWMKNQMSIIESEFVIDNKD